MSSSNNLLNQIPADIPKPKEYIFSPVGYKRHLLVDNAVVLIIDDPDKNDIEYQFNYFTLRDLWKRIFDKDKYQRVIDKLHGREEVFVDYDNLLAGVRKISPVIDSKKIVTQTMMQRFNEGFTGDTLETFVDEGGNVTMIGDTVIFSG